MPEAVPKEAIEFMTRFGGATVSALEQLIADWWYTTHPEARGNFPYTRPLPQLPFWSDIIVGGLALGTWGISALAGDELKKKGDVKGAEIAKGVEMFGEGNMFYSLPMLGERTIFQATPPKPAAAPAPGTPPPTGQPAGIVYKL